MLITVWLRQWLDVPQKAAEQSTPQILFLRALEVLIIAPAYLPSRNEVDNAHGSRKVSLEMFLYSQLFSLSISVSPARFSAVGKLQQLGRRGLYLERAGADNPGVSGDFREWAMFPMRRRGIGLLFRQEARYCDRDL